MATQLQSRRGTTAQMNAFTGAEGEIAVNTSTDTLHVHDGSTAGGHALAKADGSNIATYAGSFTTLAASGATTLSSTLAVTGEITANGGIALGDSDKATFGASDDLQIYHDGVHSRIVDAGTGNLSLQGNDLRIKNSDASATYIQAANGGAVTLHHNDAVTLATTSTGIDVTGTVTADGLTVDGNARIEEIGAIAKLTLERGGTANSADSAAVDMLETNSGTEGANFGDAGTNGFRLKLDGSANDFLIQSGAATTITTRFGIDRDSGDISFYNAAGNSQSLFWDSSAESLGIGTSSPRTLVNASSATGAILTLESSDTSLTTNGVIGGIDFYSNDSSTNGTGAKVNIRAIGQNSSGTATALTFGTSSSGSATAVEAMRIDASGTVKISHADTASEGFRVIQTTAGRTSGGALGLFYDDQAGTTQPTLVAQQNGTGDILQLFDGGSQVVTVQDGGNLLVGSSTSTGSRLSVIDSSVASKQIVFSNNATYYGSVGHNAGSGANEYRTESGGTHAFFRGTSTTADLLIDSVGAIFATGVRSSSSANNDLRYNTSNGEIYYQTSSERYKSNIADLEFDTANLYNLRPVSFDDNETGERCFGLIAEETFEQIPEAVVTRDIDGETVPDSIPYSMLSVLIINELKKLKVENDSLKARLTALENN